MKCLLHKLKSLVELTHDTHTTLMFSFSDKMISLFLAHYDLNKLLPCDSIHKVTLHCFEYETYLGVEVKETVVFEPQQQHLILLHVLLHQRPG